MLLQVLTSEDAKYEVRMRGSDGNSGVDQWGRRVQMGGICGIILYLFKYIDRVGWVFDSGYFRRNGWTGSGLVWIRWIVGLKGFLGLGVLFLKNLDQVLI